MSESRLSLKAAGKYTKTRRRMDLGRSQTPPFEQDARSGYPVNKVDINLSGPIFIRVLLFLAQSLLRLWLLNLHVSESSKFFPPFGRSLRMDVCRDTA